MEAFSRLTCAKCYIQVFLDEKILTMSSELPPRPPFLLENRWAPNITYIPDAEEDPSAVCQFELTSSECVKWKQCCKAAQNCCQMMQKITQEQDGAEKQCPATWDGVDCWPSTPPGVRVSRSCPAHYSSREVAWTKPHANRQCMEDGTWYVNPVFDMEVTNYSNCFDTKHNVRILTISLYVDFVGNGISTIALLAAIILILSAKSLRHDLQNRDSLKIHLNLFVSVVAMAITRISLDYVYFDAISKSEDSIIDRNPVWCRVVHTLAVYFHSTTYMCMFCEGFYLYRRIANVMVVGVREPLLKFFLISWLVPIVTVGLYAVLRVAFKENEKCWIDGHLNHLEFVHVVPNLLSLACNILFLIQIQWSLCTKMRTDSSDRRVSVLRHALRATLTLIPVFGLQFLFIIYRPPYWPPYEVICNAFISSQGFLVAVLYCFTTKEVRQVCTICIYGRQRQMNATSVASTRYSRMSFSNCKEYFSSVFTRTSQRGTLKSQCPNNVEGNLPDVIIEGATESNEPEKEKVSRSRCPTQTTLCGSAGSRLNMPGSPKVGEEQQEVYENAMQLQEFPTSNHVASSGSSEKLDDNANNDNLYVRTAEQEGTTSKLCDVYIHDSSDSDSPGQRVLPEDHCSLPLLPVTASNDQQPSTEDKITEELPEEVSEYQAVSDATTPTCEAHV